MNKFHAKKTACAYGCLHASKKEAQRCNALHLLQEEGVISDLQTQVAFELMPFTKYPKLTLPRKWLPKACKPLGNERKITYIADFVYQADGFRIVEDVKGKRTEEYVLKRKLFRSLYCLNSGTIFVET